MADGRILEAGGARALDSLGAALAGVTIGAASGGMVVCLVLGAAHGMARGVGQPFTWIVLGGAALGLVTAALVAFTIGRSLGLWRNLMVAVTAVAGSALVTLLTLPADIALGRAGVLALGALCLGIIVLARRVFYSDTTP